MDSLERFQCTQLQRRQLIPLNRGVILIFIIGTIPAFYPFIHYVDVHPYELWIPLILILGVFATHAALTLRTLVVATSISLNANHWDILALTGVSARRWIIVNWRAIVREVMPYHILFALLRLGLALTMAQLLHSSDSKYCYNFGLGVFCYSNYGNHYFSPLVPPLFPYPFKIIVAGITIVIYSLFEAGLLAALSLAVAIRFRHYMAMGIILMLRGLNVGIMILLWILLANVENNLQMSRPFYNAQEERTWVEIQSNINHVLPILENAQAVVSTIADNGTLLTADVMRPTWGVVTMIRNIPSAALGLLLYAGIIHAVLFLGTRTAMRRGLLP